MFMTEGGVLQEPKAAYQNGYQNMNLKEPR